MRHGECAEEGAEKGGQSVRERWASEPRGWSGGMVTEVPPDRAELFYKDKAGGRGQRAGHRLGSACRAHEGVHNVRSQSSGQQAVAMGEDGGAPLRCVEKKRRLNHGFGRLVQHMAADGLGILRWTATPMGCLLSAPLVSLSVSIANSQIIQADAPRCTRENPTHFGATQQYRKEALISVPGRERV